MLFNVVLFSSLSFAFVARAVPLEFGSKSAPRQIGSRDVVFASVLLFSADFMISSVAGHITVPNFTGLEGDMVAFGVGLDTDIHLCNTGFFGIGFTATAGQDQTSYQAMYRDPAHSGWQPMSVNISAGDVLYMTVALDPEDTTVGWALMENVDSSRVQGVRLKTGSRSNLLCGQSAAWFVGIPSNELLNYDPINFGTAKFLTAQASTTTKGILYPGDSNPRFQIIPEVVAVAIEEDNKTITFAQLHLP